MSVQLVLQSIVSVRKEGRKEDGGTEGRKEGRKGGRNARMGKWDGMGTKMVRAGRGGGG